MAGVNVENISSRNYGRRCVAAGCSNTTLNGVSMHSFPSKRPAIHRQWVAFVRRKRKHWEPSRHSVLCGKHFRDDCYPLMFRLGLMESSGRKLKKTLNVDAVPTIDSPMLTPNSRKTSVKKPRSAFVKRDVQRIIREYEETKRPRLLYFSEDHSYCISQLTSIDQERDPDRSSMEVYVIREETKTQNSHYTQTGFIGQDKACQASRPKTRDVGIMCDIIPSQTSQRHPAITAPSPDPSTTLSNISENPGSNMEYGIKSEREEEDDSHKGVQETGNSPEPGVFEERHSHAFHLSADFNSGGISLGHQSFHNQNNWLLVSWGAESFETGRLALQRKCIKDTGLPSKWQQAFEHYISEAKNKAILQFEK